MSPIIIKIILMFIGDITLQIKCSNCNKNDNEAKCQEFPKQGEISKNINLDIEQLKAKISRLKGIVYSYVLTTIEKDNDQNIIQTGSAPNFQGEYITLCSCKHYMRTFRIFRGINDGSPDVWIAGICPKALDNALFYLMKIKDTYVSQYDIWSALPEDTRKAKNAEKWPYGDLYKPKYILSEEDVYKATNYDSPCTGHVHNKDRSWYRDICTEYRKKPAMLLGDPNLSFIWTKPKLILNHPARLIHPRGQKSWKLDEFLQYVTEKTI
jgi:hypothetical protein